MNMVPVSLRREGKRIGAVKVENDPKRPELSAGFRRVSRDGDGAMRVGNGVLRLIQALPSECSRQEAPGPVFGATTRTALMNRGGCLCDGVTEFLARERQFRSSLRQSEGPEPRMPPRRFHDTGGRLGEEFIRASGIVARAIVKRDRCWHSR